MLGVCFWKWSYHRQGKPEINRKWTLMASNTCLLQTINTCLLQTISIVDSLGIHSLHHYEFTVCIAKSPWIHFLNCKFTLKSIYLHRIVFDFKIFIAISSWILRLYRDLTLNAPITSRIHHIFTINIANSPWTTFQVHSNFPTSARTSQLRRNFPTSKEAFQLRSVLSNFNRFLPT